MKNLFSLKKIGYHLWVFCEKYNLSVIWANDVDCCLSLYLTWHCLKEKIKILVVNEDSGNFIGGSIDEIPEIEEKLKDEKFVEFVKNHYKMSKVVLPFCRDVVTVSRVNFKLKK